MLRSFLLLNLMLGLAGCGGSSTANVTQTSENNYQLGVQEFEKKNYEEASRQLTIALTGGGLNADLGGQALLMRAKCHIELGRLDDALQDLELARSSPAPAEEVLVAKGEIAIKRGDLEKARSLYTKARTINSSIAWPDNLK